MRSQLKGRGSVSRCFRDPQQSDLLSRCSSGQEGAGTSAGVDEQHARGNRRGSGGSRSQVKGGHFCGISLVDPAIPVRVAQGVGDTTCRPVDVDSASPVNGRTRKKVGHAGLQKRGAGGSMVVPWWRLEGPEGFTVRHIYGNNGALEEIWDWQWGPRRTALPYDGRRPPRMAVPKSGLEPTVNPGPKKDPDPDL